MTNLKLVCFSDLEILIAPTFLHLSAAKTHIQNGIYLAAQNINKFGNGAYTGEISAEQLKDFGVDWTILGHSERRHIYGEPNKVSLLTLAHCRKMQKGY